MNKEPHKAEANVNPPDHAPDQEPARLAEGLPPKLGRSGTGAIGAMVQIAQDRLSETNVEGTPQDQVKGM